MLQWGWLVQAMVWAVLAIGARPYKSHTNHCCSSQTKHCSSSMRITAPWFPYKYRSQPFLPSTALPEFPYKSLPSFPYNHTPPSSYHPLRAACASRVDIITVLRESLAGPELTVWPGVYACI